LPIYDCRLRVAIDAVDKSAIGNWQSAMSLTRTTRRSGLLLIVLGLLGVAFFWVTDPRYGPEVGSGHGWYDPRSWIAAMRGNPTNPIDAANEATVATIVGLAGSLFVLLVGLWLLARRAV
jgi:hypothetical protein